MRARIVAYVPGTRLSLRARSMRIGKFELNARGDSCCGCTVGRGNACERLRVQFAIQTASLLLALEEPANPFERALDGRTLLPIFEAHLLCMLEILAEILPQLSGDFGVKHG